MKHKTCEHCGHTMHVFRHNLNAMLISALINLVEEYEKNPRRQNLQYDLTLTKNQYNNFQKLQYFGLVHRNEEGWIPTELGIGFIKGRIQVTVPVATFGKSILSSDHEFWTDGTHKILPKPYFVYEIHLRKYQRREEYCI